MIAKNPKIKVEFQEYIESLEKEGNKSPTDCQNPHKKQNEKDNQKL